MAKITPPDDGADNSIIQPPAAEEEPASFELPDVSISNQPKPPRKKKRKVNHSGRDQVKTLPSAVIKEQVADYEDTLREDDRVGVSRSLDPEQLFQRPGRAVKGPRLDRIWTEKPTGDFDWPELPVLPVEEEEVPERAELDVPGQDFPEDVSEITKIFRQRLVLEKKEARH